jgi:hypothetical protein
MTMPYIGRREDRSIYGLWTVQQWPGQEFLAENHADVVAARAATQPPERTTAQKLASIGITAEGLKQFLGLE